MTPPPSPAIFRPTRKRLLLGLCSLLTISSLYLPGEARRSKAHPATSPTTILQPHLQLHGEVSVNTAADAIKLRIDQLLQAAMNRSDAANKLLESEKHYKSKLQKVVQRTKDSLNYIIQYRGVSMSSEAGDVILNEKSKLKSAFSSEYFRQKHMDNLQLQIISGIMEIASGLGLSDQETGKHEVASGVKTLSDLVGQQEAQRTVETISQYAQDNPIAASEFQKRPWSIAQKHNKQKFIMEQCLNNDPVVQEIKQRVHRYNHRSKLSLATARVVQTSMGLCSFTPTLAAPLSQIFLFAFDMATGGSEEDKLIRELYLDQRLHSRSVLLNESASLGLEGYQLGMLTHNPVLMSVSKSLVGQLAGPDGTPQIFNDNLTAKRNDTTAGNQATSIDKQAAAVRTGKPL